MADQTRKYWLIIIIGFTCNVLDVPLLALTRHWWVAAFLIIAAIPVFLAVMSKINSQSL